MYSQCTISNYCFYCFFPYGKSKSPGKNFTYREMYMGTNHETIIFFYIKKSIIVRVLQDLTYSIFTSAILNFQKCLQKKEKERVFKPPPLFCPCPEEGEILGNLLSCTTALTQAFKKLHLWEKHEPSTRELQRVTAYDSQFIHSHFRHLIQTNCRSLIGPLENMALTSI